MKKKLPFKREFSAGCVVYKKFKSIKDLESLKFLLGKHSGYHKWVLPKGLIEKGEKDFETAVRETEEEMGVKAKLVSQKPIYEEEYFFVADFKPQAANPKSEILNSKQIQNSNDQNLKQSANVPERRVLVYQENGGGKVRVFKTVSFYLAEYGSGSSEDHGWEMSEVGWFTYEEALERLAFKGEKEALKKAKEKISKQEENPLGGDKFLISNI